MIGEGSERRRIFVDLDYDCTGVFRATPQISRRINHARRADRKENVAGFRGVDGRFKSIDRKHFTEPNDVGPQIAAARSTSTLFDVEVVAGAVVLKTTKAVNVSVQLDHPFIFGPGVKSVDVLGDE
jgi:hypothetical protein